MSEKKLMLGNEAIARGAWEAGVKLSAAYPGTPSTEISETLVKYKDDIYSEWSPNEKVAAEVALGASMSGVRSLASMKMVGFNVAADPVYSGSYTGVNGGMVIVVADDPGIYSSQNEQDTRQICRAAHLPVLEPSDSAEAKAFTKYAYEISEKYDTIVVLRTTTRLAHSQCLVELEERQEVPDRKYERDPAKWVMMPGNAIKKHIVVEQRDRKLTEDASEMPINRAEYNDTGIGYITAGIAYTYVKEAHPEASVLKLGMTNPLPEKLIREFASKVDRLIIFEELEPVIEEQVRAMGIACEGKDIFTRQGEYSANMLRRVIFGEETGEKPAAVPARPPILCPGCPHRSVFTALKKLKLHAAGDIGCYTLGAVAPLSVIDTTVCMGSSISTLHGMEKAKGKEYIKDWVAVIGDSTFMHTGINSLINMVYNNSTGTVIILDNRTTAMTGHQDHPGTGKTLSQGDGTTIDFETLIRSLGIENVFVINSFDQEELKKRVKEEVKADHISVIIAKAPCVLLKSNHFDKVCVPVPDKCMRCGQCLTAGCPALTKNADETISIDITRCNGCTLCMQLCKFKAIRLEED